MRKAECACGQLSIEVEGAPAMTVVCACTQCQRRTGSAFGISAYFKDDQVVAITGESKSGTRGSDSGRTLTGHFCPECGTTLYWYAEAFPGRTGIAGGCFLDPDFPPKPQRAVWAKNIHPWAHLDESIRTFDEAPPGMVKPQD
jgi:hypothetical protein